MVLKPEQDRVRALMADTVSLLCKNGLHYTKEFSIEGLLGITLDRNQVFLVNINEIVKMEGYKSESDSDGSDPGSDAQSPKSPSKKRKRRKSKSKETTGSHSGGDADDTSNDTSASFAHQSSVDTTEPPNKRLNIKEEHSDSDEDLVFIKDEPGGSGDLSNMSFSQSANLSHTGGAQNNILGDMSQHGQLYATPSSGDPSTWDPSAFNQSALSSQPPTTAAGNQQQVGTSQLPLY